MAGTRKCQQELKGRKKLAGASYFTDVLGIAASSKDFLNTKMLRIPISYFQTLLLLALVYLCVSRMTSEYRTQTLKRRDAVQIEKRSVRKTIYGELIFDRCTTGDTERPIKTNYGSISNSNEISDEQILFGCRFYHAILPAHRDEITCTGSLCQKQEES